MGEGHEQLKQVQDALRKFEHAVAEREKIKPFDSKVARRQSADHAREHVVEVVAKLVAAERVRHQ